MHSGLKVKTWLEFDLMCLASSDVSVTSAGSSTLVSRFLAVSPTYWMSQLLHVAL